jgi:hypothetical protein
VDRAKKAIAGGGLAGGWDPGRCCLTMAKGRLHVRCLTLAPNSNLGDGQEDEDSNGEDK